MSRGRTRVMTAVLVALVLVGLLVAACQTAPVSPVQVEITNWEAAAPLTGDFGEAEEPSRAAGNVEQVRALRVLNDADVGGTLDVTGNTTVGGALDITGNPSYGSLDLRPVGNAANGLIYEVGALGAITTTVVTPVAITTVTAYGCNVSDPTAAARECWAVESGGVLTFTIYGAQATPVAITTPHAASYWVAGN